MESNVVLNRWAPHLSELFTHGSVKTLLPRVQAGNRIWLNALLALSESVLSDW